MELQYEVPEENLKTFVAALHYLAQVGKELSIECDATQRVVFRALNDAHSASGQIVFDRSFFSHARVHMPPPLQLTPSRILPFVKAKVYAKSCCNLFRTLKHVQALRLTFALEDLSPDEQQELRDSITSGQDEEVEMDCRELTWTLQCDFDVTKTHAMKVHASQIMRAVFDRASCGSRWATRQFHLSSLLAHIHHTNEVCVTCSDSHVKFESYFPSTADGKAQLHTETAVESAEFSEYVLAPGGGNDPSSIDNEVKLIFGLKELRALMAFCKASDLSDIKFYFSSGGSPVLFATEFASSAKFSVELTLSTVTTFLPAASQSRSSDDGMEVMPILHQALLQNEATSESDASQPIRYLTHSKRPRIS
ncbi:TPA: hypothetical protein N0F65_007826 [Lagenidium giganteum]|uniref:Cell cycle checkpoint control protein RAD9A n=1 Tax=Lagenidium giganteum TaxID=4803 RepID=A0AAV2Z1A4_9STRA|nr:TPA: hypothetical protein N0F65_007826 [Lagenidium giganteum]